MHFLSTDSFANSADRYVKFCSVLGIPHFQVLDYDLAPIISPTNWISYDSNSPFETMLVLLTTPGTECSKCRDAAPRKEWETNSTASAAGMNLADEDGIFINSVSSVEQNIVCNDLVPTAKQDYSIKPP